MTATASLVTSIAALVVAQAAAPTPTDMARSVAPLVDRVKGSVVTIHSTHYIRRVRREDPITQYLREHFGLGEAPARRESEQSLGSGFVLNRNGTILTNNHVVAGADEVTVQLADNRRFDARVLGSDPETDVAVVMLKKPPADLKAAILGDSDKVRVGDYVLAIGNPLGLGQTVTMGIVSAKNRALGGQIVKIADFIQTDAAINQGNSGGPLFNFAGEVVGVNSAILNPAMAMNVGFAISINLAQRIANQIINNKGRIARGFLGVSTQDLTPELAQRLGIPFQPGVLVNVVDPRTPAAAAGLRPNDVITQIGGVGVDGRDQFAALIATRAPGEKVAIRVLRSGRAMDVVAVLGDTARFAGGDLDFLGARVSPVSAREAEDLGAQALRVVSVAPRSPASGSLEENDIIVAVIIGRRQVPATVASLRTLAQRVQDGGGGRLVIVRDGYQVVVSVG